MLPPIIQTALTYSALALLGGIAFAQFRKGRMGASSEIIEFYKKEAANYKDMMEKKDSAHTLEIKALSTEFHTKFSALSKDFGILQGQYNAEKEARIKAEEILKDKNPETVTFMQNTVAVLGEIKDFMGKINKHMEAEIKVESTIKH